MTHDTHKTHTIDDLDYRTHSERFTNLGAGFQVDIGGAVTLTISRHGKDGAPRIVWVNSYGNVYANHDLPLPGRTMRPPHYQLSERAAEQAEWVLNNIEHKERMGTREDH